MNAIWNGASAVVGAVVVGVTWMIKNKSKWYPILAALDQNPHSKNVVADVQAAVAAKDSALRTAMISDAVKQALLTIGNPTGELATAEKWIVQHYVASVLPADVQPYVTQQAVDGVLNALPAAISDAQKGEWYQAIQQLQGAAKA